MVGVRVHQAEQQLLEWPTAWVGVSLRITIKSLFKNPLLMSASLVMLWWGWVNGKSYSTVFLLRPALTLTEVS